MVMRAMKLRRSIVWIASAIGAAVVLLVASVLLYTPTITLRVDNDLGIQVTLAGCASDPATLDPGQVVQIDPNANDRDAACVVFLGKTREFLGCFRIPTTRYHNGATVKLSGYSAGGRPALC
jgi:hypothetical protein